MNSGLKCCLGYVTFSALFVKHSVAPMRIKYFLRTFNITLRTGTLTTPSYYKYLLKEFPKQNYDALLALDFEATATRVFTSTATDQEIIEFPCVWIDARKMKVIESFHRYVRPVVHDTLDPFCTDLTGITTQMLRKEQPFVEVFEDFKNWYSYMQNRTHSEKTVFITCGDWDLKTMLPSQCRLSQVKIPSYLKQWINVKNSFCDHTGRYPNNLKHMISMLNLRKYGRLHRGMDDTINVVNIVIELAKRGHVFSK